MTFNPTPEILQTLIDKPLTAGSLLAAFRRLIILKTIHCKNSLGIKFSFDEWKSEFLGADCQLSFQPRSNCNREDCCCHTSSVFSFLSEIGINDWKERISDQHTISIDELDKKFNDKPFKIGYGTLENDFDFLAGVGNHQKSWIQKTVNAGERNLYSKLANDESPQSKSSIADLAIDRVCQVSEVLDFLSIIDPRVYPVLEEHLPDLFPDSTRRLIIDTDFFVSKNNETIGDIVEKIRELWRQDDISPLAFGYSSSSKRKDINCTVYPVCFRFYMRALYLYAWGHSPETEENNDKYDWYAYRVDHIKNDESFKQLSWDDSQANRLQEAKSFTPEHVINECEKAWGLDIQKDVRSIILCFKRTYFDGYIKGTYRGPKAGEISREEAISIFNKLFEDKVIDKTQHTQLISRIEAHRNDEYIKTHGEDAYYQAHFRKGDNYTIMRLRSWGHKIEVLYPPDLREEILNDAQRAIDNYSN